MLSFFAAAVPSDPPRIFTDDGQLLFDLTKPVEERVALTLVCETRGGDPLPRLSWWRGKSLIDPMMENVDRTNGIVRNTLSLQNLQRTNQGEKITCKAANTNLTSPQSATVAINMVCKYIFHIHYLTPTRNSNSVQDFLSIKLSVFFRTSHYDCSYNMM